MSHRIASFSGFLDLGPHPELLALCRAPAGLDPAFTCLDSSSFGQGENYIRAGHEWLHLEGIVSGKARQWLAQCCHCTGDFRLAKDETILDTCVGSVQVLYHFKLSLGHFEDSDS